MSKYRKAAERMLTDQAFQREQQKLHEKYQEPPDIIIKEKSNMAKFTVKTLGNILRMLATVVVMVLAAIGILTLLYGNIRYEFMLVIQSIFGEIGTM